MARKRSVRTGFEQRLLATLRDGPFELGERAVVGFSGGPDSLAVALGLRRVAPILGLTPLLVHVDHGLRPTSVDDAAACQALALGIGLAFTSSRLPSDLPQRSAGRGVEEQARRERYEALALAAAGWGANSILLGHQADDQAETVLLHLVRGSGLRGLAGMRPVESRPIPWWDDGDAPIGVFRIVRPLLAERRATIEAYLAEFDLAPLQDESNQSMDYDRNWMRHQVVPAIEARWPAAIESIARTANAVRIDSDFLDSLAQTDHPDSDFSDRTLCTDDLLEMAKALAYRRIRQWLGAVGVGEPGFDVVARIYDFAQLGDETASIEIGSGHTAVLARNRLLTFDELVAQSAAHLPMQTKSQDQQWDVELAENPGAGDGWVSSAAHGEVSVRTILEGDRWAGTNRSVMEDLRAAGIHPQLRRLMLAVVDENGVLLIPAIYPTIHANVLGEGIGRGWIRWSSVQPRKS